MSIFGVFLVCIFLHLDWIRRNTPYLSVFTLNAGKYGPEWTVILMFMDFWQWIPALIVFGDNFKGLVGKYVFKLNNQDKRTKFLSTDLVSLLLIFWLVFRGRTWKPVEHLKQNFFAEIVSCFLLIFAKKLHCRY